MLEHHRCLQWLPRPDLSVNAANAEMQQPARDAGDTGMTGLKALGTRELTYGLVFMASSAKVSVAAGVRLTYLGSWIVKDA